MLLILYLSLYHCLFDRVIRLLLSEYANGILSLFPVGQEACVFPLPLTFHGRAKILLVNYET